MGSCIGSFLGWFLSVLCKRLYAISQQRTQKKTDGEVLLWAWDKCTRITSRRTREITTRGREIMSHLNFGGYIEYKGSNVTVLVL